MDDRTVVARAADTAAVAELVEVVDLLAGVPSPFGAEAELADVLVRWGSARWPELHWSLDRFDETRANVLVEAGTADRRDAFGFYAHLDTTLTGDVTVDAAITGDASPVPPCRRDGGDLVGLGLSVAKAPAAAALVALATAARRLISAVGDEGFRLQLLLTSGGTHRLPPGATSFGAGARRALDSGFRPAALLNVKGGAPAPLAAEPGAAYLGIRVEGRWEPALFRGASPGVVGALGPLVEAVESWRTEFVADGDGTEVALGAVRVGDLAKPDLMPGAITARAFVVLSAVDVPARLADDLQARIARAVGPDFVVTVTVDAWDRAGATPPDHRLVELVGDEWCRRFGEPPEVTNWRGSTDGVTFRAAGIPTVRVGPVIGRDEGDLRLDRVRLDDLAAFADLYADVATRWFLDR